MVGDADNTDEFIEVNGIRLCYKQSGENIADERSIVFVHGLSFSKENMDPLFDYYRSLHHVVSYDVRGHGSSDKPNEWTLEDDIEDLHGLIESLSLEKPIGIGFSMGSYITLATAEKYPDLFSKIVLIGTKGNGSSSIKAIASSSGSASEAKDAVLKKIYAPQDTHEQISSFFKSIASPVKLSRAQHDAIYRSLEGFDNLKDAGDLNIPVLCLTGQYDGVNPPAKGKTLSVALPKGTFYEVPRAGHITFFENFDYTVARIDEFLCKG